MYGENKERDSNSLFQISFLCLKMRVSSVVFQSIVDHHYAYFLLLETTALDQNKYGSAVVLRYEITILKDDFALFKQLVVRDTGIPQQGNL